MTYDEAVQLRNRAKILIGQKAEGSNHNIDDVVIVPLDHIQLFTAHYLRGVRADKDFEKLYPSANYYVKVVLGIGSPNFWADDIEVYAARISGIQK